MKARLFGLLGCLLGLSQRPLCFEPVVLTVCNGVSIDSRRAVKVEKKMALLLERKGFDLNNLRKTSFYQ